MKYLAAIFILFELVVGTCNAAQLKDGSFFLRECSAAIKQADKGALSAQEQHSATFCISYVAGFLDALPVDNDPRSSHRNICLPTRGIVNEEAIRIFVKYLRENPDVIQESGRMSLYLSLATAFPCAVTREQRNVTFGNIPEFLRSEWTIVLGKNHKSEIDSANGSLILGNAIAMFSSKEKALVIDDYLSFQVAQVVQYNLSSKHSDTGYITFFHLTGKEGDVLLFPGVDFWDICIRSGHTGPYAVYTAIQQDQMQTLKDTGRYERYLADSKKLLQANYEDRSQGL